MTMAVKTHALYGNVRFVKDYDGIYKPVAGDVLNITGNNTVEKYNADSLLEKRELYRLIESSTDNIDLFKEWINNNYDKLNKTTNSSVIFKNEAEILNTITLDDFAYINLRPFSCNHMYKAHKNKIERTANYNAWWGAFPVEELYRFKDVDFNKPIFVWYYFKHIKKFDTENLLKPVSDRIASYFAADDSNFKHFRIDGEYVDNTEESCMYIFICNIEETGPFK